MRTFSHVIQDPEGLHARPAATIAACAMKLSCEVRVAAKGATCLAKDPVGLLMLNARQGDELTVTIEGAHEEADEEALREVFSF